MPPCKYLDGLYIHSGLYINSSISFQLCIYRCPDPRLTGARENPIAIDNIYDMMEDNVDETASTADLVPEKSPFQ